MFICSAYYAMSEETQEIIDNIELTVVTICTWKDTWFVIRFANSINLLVGKYAYAPSFGPYKLLIHTLTTLTRNFW